ncbi:MAG TPA: tRNA pseudouridine(38-40) synthase TruA [Bacteroidales bacterium]|nr:tRNA pseudouridine(38-40) synthase TruA [Bacteroidales bacterium]
MTRYFIFISFKGTYYHGWQLQPNSKSVQETLGEALSLILGEQIAVTGAGRTDAGVHARMFCAHFDCSRCDLAQENNIIFRLNRFLPGDISVTVIRKVRPDAHARFSAISRTYEYHISLEKDPFTEESSWYIHGMIDTGLMNTAAGKLLLHDDFTSFSKLHSGNKNNICSVYEASWTEAGKTLIFRIRANRFLRNMVRAITGTLIDVGRGKITPEEFEKIILSRDRSRAGMSAPARGLFLTDIEYPSGIFV